ncbi:UbiA family prenyltransferase [Litorilinea aerophila]|uniref:Geranylgeranylglycerol-phosphate geranylgeranyltransferase n=1 Tax=Litorilinea aerophila TaxID=1204385 RepID=A0A540VK30_9CHLR|nr:UbiA family prenyltransferase [Litorilinea aerophila]MCC9075212.1 UbiA family prenyltransferase [Litorilinea aerophila]
MFPLLASALSWVADRPLARSWATLRLLRLSNSLPASVLVLLGARLAGIWPPLPPVWRAAAAMWCITAFGYVSNDLVDQAEDAINKPDRPLPAGAVTPAAAGALATALALGGLLLAASLGLLATAVAGGVVGLLIFYNLRLKALPLAGNTLVALLAAASLWVGPVAVWGIGALTAWPRLEQLLPPTLLLASFIQARELVKTLEDIPGDAAAGKTTAAVRWGVRPTLTLVAGLALLATGFTLISVGFGDFSPAYLVLVLVGVDLPLLATVAVLWRDASPRRVSRCLAWLKGSYFCGLLALILA